MTEKVILYILTTFFIALGAFILTIFWASAFMAWFDWYEYSMHKFVWLINFVVLRFVIFRKC